MKIARRLFLRAATLLWSLAGAAHAGPSKREPRRPVLSAADARILRRYVDLLIPADHTPSGSALAVDVRLREVASGQRDYQVLLEHGLAWLQAQAMARFGRGFVQLAATQCEVIVEHMAKSLLTTMGTLVRPTPSASVSWNATGPVGRLPKKHRRSAYWGERISHPRQAVSG